MVSVALILLADDHGNGRAHPLYLASRIWPYSSRDPAEMLATLSRALGDLVECGFLQLYSVNGQQCFSLRNWKKHQRVDKPSRPHVPGPEKADAPTGLDDLPPETRAGAEPVAKGSGGAREGLVADLDLDLEGKGVGGEPREGLAPACLPKGIGATETDAQAVSADWNREAHAKGAIGNPYRKWTEDFRSVAVALHRLGPDKHVARVALCAWWWRAPEGPIAAGRVALHRANPGHLAKHLGADLEAAREWFEALDEDAQAAILAGPSAPSAEASA